MSQFVVKALFLCIAVSVSLFGQTAPKAGAPKTEKTAPRPADDCSGMYSFLQEGEFLQLTVESDGRLTGFVSRYGDLDSDRGVFLDQFFKQARLTDKDLSFTTETVHGVWFEFKGTIGQGASKRPGDEGYRVLKGTLVQSKTDAAKKITSQTRDVIFKSLPLQDEGPSTP